MKVAPFRALTQVSAQPRYSISLSVEMKVAPFRALTHNNVYLAATRTDVCRNEGCPI